MGHIDMPWDCYYNQFPETIKVLIFVELCLFNIMFLSAVGVCIYCKYQIYRYKKELKRNKSLTDALASQKI